MVQFLSINFLGFLQFLLGFSKVPVFCVTLYSLKESPLVLMCNPSEMQPWSFVSRKFVERTVEGIRPIQRARFVFQAPPASFLQLEDLEMVVRNIAYAGQSRAARPEEVNIGAIKSPPEPENPMYSHARTSQFPRSGKPVVCYYCRKPGQTQKMGFLPLSQLCKPARPVAKSQPGLGMRSRKIAGFVTSLVPSIRAQIGKLCLTALLDSGSVRS